MFARELLRVPDMRGMGRLAAEEALARFGLTGFNVIWRSDATEAVGGPVLSSSPDAWAAGIDPHAFDGEFGLSDAEPPDDVHVIPLARDLGVVNALAVWPERGNVDASLQPGWNDFVDDIACAADWLLEVDWLKHAVRKIERAEHVQRALFAIATMASSDLEMTEMLQGIHGIIGQLTYAENFFIALYEAERDSLRFLYFVDSVDKTPIDSSDIPAATIPNSLSLAVIRTGESQMGPSSEVRARLGMLRGQGMGPESEDWLGVPMVGARGISGVIVVQSYLAHTRYTEDDRALLTYVAQHVLTALERKQAQTDLERRVQERTSELARANQDLHQEVAERQRGERLQSALFRIAERASTADSIDRFYASVHAIVGELIDARNFYIALVSEDGNELEFPYSVDEIDAVRPRRRMRDGMTEYALRTGRAVLADRAQVEELVRLGVVRTSGPHSTCWLGVPLTCDERTVGVLAVQSYDERHIFTIRDQELLTFVGFHVASALERKLAQESLRHAYVELEARVEARTRELAQANNDLVAEIRERERVEAQLMFEALHDTLTGLPNRALLLERLDTALERYRRDRRDFAVLFLDLDRFKVINDSVGHLVGDEVLKQAATRLAHACPSALVARLGGDEFAVLLENLPRAEHAVDVAEQLLGALVEPMRVGGKELYTSASIGIAYASPQYRRGEELLRDADAAMYRAKAEGRQRHEIFDEVLRAQAVRALELEGELRHALAHGGFEAHFQSIVRLEDARVAGYEALLRWRHPVRGLLAPDEFLAAAQENGCIEAIDWRMFELACEAATRLPGDSYVSINVSPRQLHATGFADLALHLIAETGVSPRRVRLEITEGALLGESEHVHQTLSRLRDAGVRVQLDDFGTGYSSLSYLHRFPIHALKIDRSFISNLGDGSPSVAVVRAISTLAHSLGIEVIAEGVETEAQRAILLDLGCSIGQGFLFSMPRSLNDIFGVRERREDYQAVG